MCLTIDKSKHLKRTGLFSFSVKPIVAENDIVVYKCIQKCEDGSLKTPYRSMPIQFDDNGLCELDCQYDGLIITRKFGEKEFGENQIYFKNRRFPFNFLPPYYVSKCGYGFHAYTDMISALRRAACGRWVVLTAIIPKGAHVFYGMNDDICASRMIIYEKPNHLIIA